MSNESKLIYMANQIGAFFHAQKPELAVPGIADHLAKFWEPRMREKILKHLDEGGEGLNPLVKEALQHLKSAGSTPFRAAAQD